MSLARRGARTPARTTCLLALSLSLGACDGAETSAVGLAASRLPGTLQLETAVALPTSLAERAKNGNVSWTPPIAGNDGRLLVPAQVIEVRDTVRAGQPVDVVVNTIGENGCWQADGGALTQRGDSALVQVFDRHSGAGACTDILTDRLAHRFTTVFPRAGVGVIRASGRRSRVGTPVASLASSAATPTVVAERTVVVLP